MTSDERRASMIEVGAIRPAADRYDVVILGGGLAGLTLSIQIKRLRPDTSVLVLEKREGPAPLAAFKVGESTVHAGAHYFAEVVGMKDHLEEKQNRKMGLRFFLPAGDNSDITKRVESGPIRWPPVTTYQIDRGLFENELAARARAAGVDVVQGARVGNVDFGDDSHTVHYSQGGEETQTRGRWVVDAAGRASLLKRQLGLSREVGHTINSAWFRLGGGLDIEQWGIDDETWMTRVPEPGARMFSTNHLLGEGYWVWLIPLATGPISIGVCADPRVHPFEEINELDRMMDWLRRHEPQLAGAVEPRRGEIEDFLRVEDFAYGVERICSPERWCLVGEAAAFADPFLSPGSDMIAYSNTFASDLITRELAGQDIAERADYFDDLYQRTFEYVLARTEDMYPVFSNPWVMSIKHSWDAWYGHSGIVLLFGKGKLTDVDFMGTVDGDLDRLFRMGIGMHALLRQWHELEQREWENDFLKTGIVTPIREGFSAPLQEYTDDELRAHIRHQVEVSEAITVVVFHKAAKALDDPPDDTTPVNPYAVGLNPGSWEADGLFAGETTLTLEQARERVENVDWLFLDFVPGS